MFEAQSKESPTIRGTLMSHLFASLEAAFTSMDRVLLKRACKRFRPKMEAGTATDGAHIE